MSKLTLPIVLGALVALATMTSGSAEAQTDQRWLPWLGCWQSTAERQAGEAGRVCVVPAADANAVAVIVVTEDGPLPERLIIADGTLRSFDEVACSGRRRTAWSRGGYAVYTSGELTCTGEPNQTLSGFSLFTKDSTWLDIHVGSAPGRETVQVRRYTRTSVPHLVADRLPLELLVRAVTASERPPHPITLQDVIEASGMLVPRAVEAALVETNTVVPINRQSLIALDDASVSQNVIDLMVALAYPERFDINRPVRASMSSVGVGGPFYPSWWARPLWYDPFWDDSFSLYNIRRFGIYSRTPDTVIFLNANEIGATLKPSNTRDGARAGNGLGYTRVSPAVPAREGVTGTSRVRPNNAPGSRSGDGNAAGRSIGGSANSSSGSDASSSGGSSSAGASPAGYSSSGGGDGGGRTAVPR
jgi:hypothetical protein